MLCLALSAALIAQARPDVSSLIAKMQSQPADSGYLVIKTFKASDAPAVIQSLRKIERPSTFSEVANWLYSQRAKESIPVLVDSLQRDLILPGYPQHAATQTLMNWGWHAYNDLLRAVRTGSPIQKERASGLLVNACSFRPVDRRIIEVVTTLARDSNGTSRLLGARALWNLSCRITGDGMEGIVNPTGIENPKAYELLLELAYDRDRAIAMEVRHLLLRYMWTNNRDLKVGISPQATDQALFEQSAALRKVLKSKDPYMRAGATALLASMGDSTVVYSLRDTYPFVRRIALLGMGPEIPSYWIKSLAPGLLVANPGIQIDTATALGRTYSLEAVPLLEALLSSKNVAVRKAGRVAIDRIEGRGLVTK